VFGEESLELVEVTALHGGGGRHRERVVASHQHGVPVGRFGGGQGRAEADGVAVGVDVAAFAQPVVGVDRRVELSLNVRRGPTGVELVGVTDEQVHADRVRGRIGAIEFAHVQFDPVAVHEAVAALLIRLGLEPERPIVGKGPSHVGAGQDRNGPLQAAALLAEPAETVLTQDDFGMTAQPDELILRARLAATPAHRRRRVARWFVRHCVSSRSSWPMAATSRHV
jgi:hypothetical protein